MWPCMPYNEDGVETGGREGRNALFPHSSLMYGLTEFWEQVKQCIYLGMVN